MTERPVMFRSAIQRQLAEAGVAWDLYSRRRANGMSHEQALNAGPGQAMTSAELQALVTEQRGEPAK